MEKKIDRKKSLESILVIVLGFLILKLIFDKEIFYYIALGVGVLGAASNYMAEKITWLWYKIAYVLGYINTRILLSIVFFLVLSPVAFFAKIFSKDKLNLRGEKKSYYVNREQVYKAEDLENIF